MSKAAEHKIGSTVTLDLPASRGGKQKLKVVVSSSCVGCALSGLGHTMCRDVACGRDERTDGVSVNYEEVEARD